jgi:DNA ligase D-like protein (predicted ligase)
MAIRLAAGTLASVRHFGLATLPRIVCARVFSGYPPGVKIQKSRVAFIEPMLALAVTKLPVGPVWSYELKFDGYRAIGMNTVGQVRLFSRNGKDFTKRFSSIVRALEALPNDTVIDGELIAYDADGRPSFNVLQNYRAGPELHLYAFDLLTLRGRDLTRKPLEQRREILLAEVMPLLPDSIRYSETLEASPAELIEAVREQGFEGIVAKRRDSLYKPGQRSAVWQKMRVLQRRDFVIGGYTPAGRNFGAILAGDYEGRALKYVAKVHGGFAPPVREAVFKRFQGLETNLCPFKNLPEARRGQWGEGLTAAEMEKCPRLKPRLVATIDYLERTVANHLRHAMFVGLSKKSALRGS